MNVIIIPTTLFSFYRVYTSNVTLLDLVYGDHASKGV